MATKAVGMSARLRAVLAAVGLALLAGGVLGGLQEAAAQEIKAQETGAFDTGGMELLSIDVGVVGEGTVRIKLRLPGVVLDDDELIVNIHGPVDSESHFLATTQGQSLGGVLQSQMTPASELEVNSAGVVELLLNINQPPETGSGTDAAGTAGVGTATTGTANAGAAAADAAVVPSIRLVADGVYPLTIELRTQGQQLVARISTHIVHVATASSDGTDSSRGDGNNRLSVLLLADLTSTGLTDTGQTGTGTAGTRLTSTRLTGTGPTGTVSAWLDVLSRNADVPILAKVTPQWLTESSNLDAAQRLAQESQAQTSQAQTSQAQESQAQESQAQGTASQLRLVHNPYYPVNQITLADAGLNDELDHLFVQGAQTLAEYAPLAPPTLFVSRETTAAQQLAVGAVRGVRTAVLPVEALAVLDESSAPGSSATGSSGGTLGGFPFRAPVEVRVPNEGLAPGNTATSSIRTLLIDHLAPPHPTDSPDAAAQRLLAHLATIALDGSRINKSDEVVVLDLTAADHSPELAAAILTGLDQLTLVQAVSAEQAFSKPLLSGDGAPPADLFLATASATGGVNQTYFDTSRQLSSYRSMIRDEDAGTYNELVQDLLSTLASDAVPAQQENQWQQISNFVKLQASQLDATSSTSVRLTSRSAQVPFSFQNNGSIPLRVELRLVSDKLTVENFDDGESTTLVLQPGVTTQEFGLRTLGSGAFVVDLELHSPDGNLLIGSIPIVMQSTAPTWAGFLLATGATAFLLIWWIVDSRRRRLNRASVDGPERNA